jgi:hypothetical protein
MENLILHPIQAIRRPKKDPAANISKEYWSKGLKISVFCPETPLLFNDPDVETITIQYKI